MIACMAVRILDRTEYTPCHFCCVAIPTTLFQERIGLEERHSLTRIPKLQTCIWHRFTGQIIGQSHACDEYRRCRGLNRLSRYTGSKSSVLYLLQLLFFHILVLPAFRSLLNQPRHFSCRLILPAVCRLQGLTKPSSQDGGRRFPRL